MAGSVTLARQGSWSLADDAQSTDQDPFLVDSNTEFDTKRDLFSRGLDRGRYRDPFVRPTGVAG